MKISVKVYLEKQIEIYRDLNKSPRCGMTFNEAREYYIAEAKTIVDKFLELNKIEVDDE